MVVMGAPTYVNIGSTTEFEGDVGIPVGSDYYIGNDSLNLDDLVSGWNFTHLEDQLFFGELAGIANVKHSKFDATTSPTVNDDVDLEYVVGSHWVDITNDKEYICLDNTDGAAVWTETTQVAGGYTNLTSFVEQTVWRVFYSDSLGDITELALGADGTYLKSGGAAVAPTWSTPAGAGDVVKVGTPANSQIGVWTGDGTIEGAASLTYDGANLQLTGDIGSTGTKITKGWFTDLLVTNAISGSITGNTVTFTCTDNESESLNCPLVFVDGATGAQGAETDGDLYYNPSTGLLTATGFAGSGASLTGANTGFTSILNAALYVGRDADNQIKFSTDNKIIFRVNAADKAEMISTGELDMNAGSVGFTLQTATGDGTTTVNWTLGNKFKFTFGAQNDTFTFTAPTNPCNLLLVLVQDATGSRLATWPSIKWVGGTAPTLTTAANGEDIVSFFYDGTSYYGVASLAFATP